MGSHLAKVKNVTVNISMIFSAFPNKEDIGQFVRKFNKAHGTIQISRHLSNEAFRRVRPKKRF